MKYFLFLKSVTRPKMDRITFLCSLITELNDRDFENNILHEKCYKRT